MTTQDDPHTDATDDDPQAAPPLSIGRVTLTVHDLDRVTAFYRDVIGLAVIASGPEAATLGAGQTPLIELRRDIEADRRNPRDPGLFHTAFLLPGRADLGRWLGHATATNIRLSGASDHLVSEALYLNDPEGNGVEIYADRPREAWSWTGGMVTMSTEQLDLDDLLGSAGGEPWRGFPEDGIIGHVHLQVGAIPPADAFYADVLGLDVTCRYPGATFLSSGGYHHHLATNIWNSRGGPARLEPVTGLADVEIMAQARLIEAIRVRAAKAGIAIEEQPSGVRLLDPWNAAITITERRV